MLLGLDSEHLGRERAVQAGTEQVSLNLPRGLQLRLCECLAAGMAAASLYFHYYRSSTRHLSLPQNADLKTGRILQLGLWKTWLKCTQPPF